MGKKPAALAFDNNIDYNYGICTHLILGGLCPHCPTTFIINASSSSTNKNNKRKLLESQATTNNEETAKRKKKGCGNNQEEKGKGNLSWDCTTELKLYDDPWKIKKVLEKSDLGNMSRLLIGTEIAENLIVLIVGGDNRIDVTIKDVDTNSMHNLVFKKWGSSRSYVFIKNWRKEFVVRRGLKEGDEIGLQWDPYNQRRFNFSVLRKAQVNAN